jgi:hypothetical protein
MGPTALVSPDTMGFLFHNPDHATRTWAQLSVGDDAFVLYQQFHGILDCLIQLLQVPRASQWRTSDSRNWSSGAFWKLYMSRALSSPNKAHMG